MSGQIIHRPEQPHPCEHPPDGTEPTGTQWRCGDCGDVWTAFPTASSAASDWEYPTWWYRPLPDPDLPDPGIPESGYRVRRWPWRRSKETA